MARTPKCRRVCRFPKTVEFAPVSSEPSEGTVIMTVDEYEIIRLIDQKGLSQEQCSERMQIARTSVQRSYEIARRKLADVLVDGMTLRIEGGSYRLCNGYDTFCVHESCKSP